MSEALRPPFAPGSPRRKRACALWLAALGLLVVSSARPQSQEKPRTLRVTTRLVNVNAVVRDARGNLVKGLGKDDFTILDEGKPQQISFFSAVDNVRPDTPVPETGPDTYTNVLARGGATPSVTILLFDALNSNWTSQGYGLNRIRKFLRQIEPEDHIGIYVLRGNLYVVHDFTRDAAGLVQSIRRYDEKHAHVAAKPDVPEEDTTGDPQLDRFLSGKDFGLRFSYEGYRTADQVTTAALESIGRQLTSVPGRKTLIWVTDSISRMGRFLQSDVREFERSWHDVGPPLKGPDTEKMIRLMNDANISIYVVNSAGLQAQSWSFRMNAYGPLLELASRTGGRAFINRNDLETGIRRAADDSRYSYALAYAPDHNQWNGDWRKLQLKVNRPGLTVLARGGYFALPDAIPVPQKRRIDFYRQLAASPVEATALPLSVHVAASRSASGPNIQAIVHIDVAPMLTSQANGHWTGNFELMFVQIGGNKILGATPQGVHADLKPQQYPSAAQNGWDLRMQLKLFPGAETLCVILYDDGTDSVGSVRIPLARYGAPAASQ